VKAALLCCQPFVKNLKSIGCEINPCDPCVANKVVQGKQPAVVWHVQEAAVKEIIGTQPLNLKACFLTMHTPSQHPPT
jgi:hypothetical protein